VTRQGEKYRLNPSIRVWEGPNEPVFGNADDPANVQAMAWYADFEAERLRLLADQGLRGVVGNFATGNPDLPLWPAFLPAVAAARQHGGTLGLHEYSSPWMWWLTGNFQTGNCDHRPDFAGEGDTGFLTLRYRKVYRDFLAPAGLDDVPLLITECGLDSIGALCPGYTSGPWKDHLDFWGRHDGAHDPIDYWRGAERDAERYYAEQLMWYDRELQKDPYVIGATIFTVGATAGQWAGFDIGGARVTQHVVEHIRLERSVPTPPAPGGRRPSPEPPPGPEGEATADAEEVVIEPPPSGAAGDSGFVPAGPAPASPSSTSDLNLLANGRFEQGRITFAGATRELAVPAGWTMTFRAEDTPTLPGLAGAFGRPVTALINSLAVPPEERARLFAHGAYLWKATGVTDPLWVRLEQLADGLPAGAHLRLEALLLPDLWAQREPQPAYAADPLAGEARLLAESGGQVFESGWVNGTGAPFGRFTWLALTFTTPAAQATVALELRTRGPLPLAAWYVAEIRLAATA
jgi:hypothetical protein